MGTRPTVISLFAGCGGSSLGYEMAGFEELAAVEFGAVPARDFRLNFQGVRVYEEDIARLDPARVAADLGIAAGDLTVLDSSPPCQGFSLSGKRLVSDGRNDLFLAVVRWIYFLRPRAFVMENVPAQAFGRMRGKFLEILAALRATGYAVKCRILNAANYGVPQTRRRIFYVGVRPDIEEKFSWPDPRPERVSFREATLACPMDNSSPSGMAEQISRVVVENILKKIPPGKSGKILFGRGKCFNLWRAESNRPCRTIVKTVICGKSALSGVIHPSEDRLLTIPEVKRLCSFPDDFRTSGTFEEQWGVLGNSVPPLMAKAVAGAVRRIVFDK